MLGQSSHHHLVCLNTPAWAAQWGEVVLVGGFFCQFSHSSITELHSAAGPLKNSSNDSERFLYNTKQALCTLCRGEKCDTVRYQVYFQVLYEHTVHMDGRIQRLCVWCWVGKVEVGVCPTRQQGLEAERGRNCAGMTSEPQAQSRLWLQKPQQEGLAVCLARVEWMQHRGLPPHIDRPDCVHAETAGAAFCCLLPWNKACRPLSLSEALNRTNKLGWGNL